jgi:hypothetical protein
MEIQTFLGDFSVTKYLFLKNSTFFKNSGKTRRFSFNNIIIFKNSGKTKEILLITEFLPNEFYCFLVLLNLGD